MGLVSEKLKVLYVELKERTEAATGSYSVTGNSLQYIYFVSVSKNDWNIWWRCLFMNFPWQIFFNNINHGYREAILKKSSLWQLLFYMVVATHFCYEKVHRMMCTAIVSNLLNTPGTTFYRKSLIQCCPRSSRQYCTGKNSGNVVYTTTCHTITHLLIYI